MTKFCLDPQVPIQKIKYQHGKSSTKKLSGKALA
jgi:hypothetical protein